MKEMKGIKYRKSEVVVRIDMVELQNIVELQVFLMNLLIAPRIRFSCYKYNVISLLVLDPSRFVSNFHAN